MTPVLPPALAPHRHPLPISVVLTFLVSLPSFSLYAPSESIAALSTRDLARKFFRTNFSPPSSAAPDSPQSLDILSLMGEDQVLDDFESARRGGLTIVSVEPVSYGSGGGVLLGDAGHSMGTFLTPTSHEESDGHEFSFLTCPFSLMFRTVPFYGQGLNCGLEDVRVLDSFLAKHGITGTAGSRDELAAALNEYSSARKEDLKAILQLAYDN
jgi:kynurenine 3-monooxygenase